MPLPMALPRAIALMRCRTHRGAFARLFQSFSRSREQLKGVRFWVRPRCAVFGPDGCGRQREFAGELRSRAGFPLLGVAKLVIQTAAASYPAVFFRHSKTATHPPPQDNTGRERRHADRARRGRTLGDTTAHPSLHSRAASRSSGARGSGDRRSDDAASAAPFSVPGRLLIGPDQSTGVSLHHAANTLGTLRRALEHSAHYAGPAAARPQARTVGDLHRSSARDHNTAPARSRAAMPQSRLRIISQRYV